MNFAEPDGLKKEEEQRGQVFILDRILWGVKNEDLALMSFQPGWRLELASLPATVQGSGCECSRHMICGMLNNG
jgi:hypothetical protein